MLKLFSIFNQQWWDDFHKSWNENFSKKMSSQTALEKESMKRISVCFDSRINHVFHDKYTKQDITYALWCSKTIMEKVFGMNDKPVLKVLMWSIWGIWPWSMEVKILIIENFTDSSFQSDLDHCKIISLVISLYGIGDIILCVNTISWKEIPCWFMWSSSQTKSAVRRALECYALIQERYIYVSAMIWTLQILLWYISTVGPRFLSS